MEARDRLVPHSQLLFDMAQGPRLSRLEQHHERPAAIQVHRALSAASSASAAQLSQMHAALHAHALSSNPYWTPTLAQATELARRDIAAGLIAFPGPRQPSPPMSVPRPAATIFSSPHRPVRHHLRDCHLETNRDALAGGHAHHHGASARRWGSAPAVKSKVPALSEGKLRAACQQTLALQRDIHAKVCCADGSSVQMKTAGVACP